MVANQVDRVIIVDNSASAEVRARLEDEVSSRIELVLHNENLGIAAALNTGVRRAAALRARWVLTLDQDTAIDESMVAKLLAGTALSDAEQPVGIIGSTARTRGGSPVVEEHGAGAITFAEAKTVITSGSLISVSAYADAGPFRETFFIEGVDLEYCLRLRSRGYRVLLAAPPLMTHAAGKGLERRFVWRTVVVPDHQPWRYYYQVRNLTLITRQYAGREPAWVAHAWLNVAKMSVRIGLFEHSPLCKYRSMLLGIWDACVRPLEPPPIRRNVPYPRDSIPGTS
jgi:rhamnosyltransferase